MERKIFGGHVRECCPLCNGKNTQQIWKIPFGKTGESFKVNKINMDYFPTLDAKMIYSFDECNDCESVYLNPNVIETGHSDDSKYYIEKMKNESYWKGYYARYDYFKKFFKKEYKVFADVACSVGQYAQIAKKDKNAKFSRVLGFEYSKSYVDYMNSIGIEAYKLDLNKEQFGKYMVKGKIDFIVFSEAFEHMQDSLVAMRKIVDALTIGGRVFFSAQALGGSLPIRHAETLYISQKGLNILANKLNCKVVDRVDRHDRFFIILEKIK